MTQVLVTGGVSWDTLIYLDQLPPPVPATIFSHETRETVGSTGAGKALNLNRLEIATTLHALVGEDAPGEAIRAFLAAANLHFAADPDPRGTERHLNLMAGGDRISIYTHYATFEPALDLDRLSALIGAADVVALNIINYCRYLIPMIQAQGKPIWCDIHDYDGTSRYHQDFIAAADVLFFSTERLPDHRAFMQEMIASGKRLVVGTQGAAGSLALTADGAWIDTPALTDYPLRDTNGAGDAFFAGVLYGMIQGYPVERALRTGTIVAGLCISAPELVYPDLSPALVEAEYRRQYLTG